MFGGKSIYAKQIRTSSLHRGVAAKSRNGRRSRWSGKCTSICSRWYYSNQGGFPGGAVRIGNWKLVEDYRDGSVQLFNLEKDLDEQNDVADQHPERVERMRTQLHNWYEDVDARFLRAKEDGPDGD